jgi:hypothetical protein
MVPKVENAWHSSEGRARPQRGSSLVLFSSTRVPLFWKRQ